MFCGNRIGEARVWVVLEQAGVTEAKTEGSQVRVSRLQSDGHEVARVFRSISRKAFQRVDLPDEVSG